MSAPPIPTRAPDGEFASFNDWGLRALNATAGQNALCVDAKDRVCATGADFMRASTDGSYPIRYWLGAGGQTADQQAAEATFAEGVRMRLAVGGCGVSEMVEIVARAICRVEHVLLYGTEHWREGELDAKVEKHWREHVPAASRGIYDDTPIDQLWESTISEALR